MEPIPFRTQFIQCGKDGLTNNTRFFSFEEFPELLPAFPNKEGFLLIKSGEWNGNPLIICGKFGGICNGGHAKCRKMRGLPRSKNKQPEYFSIRKNPKPE